MGISLNAEQLHHGYLIAGEGERTVSAVEEFLIQTLSFPVQANPDFIKEEFSLFGIDDSHRIADIHTKKPIVHNRKVFVLSCESFSLEAQNALLKMFEEPNPGTLFFLIVPSTEIVLPTLRSRLIGISLNDDREKTVDISLAKKFFAGTIAERLSVITPIITEKDKSGALRLLSTFELYLKDHYRDSIHNKELQQTLQDILMFQGYMRDRAPSIKMMLEHIAYTAPTV